MDIDLVISTGDNFYDNGLKDVRDKAFEESFTNVYTAKSLQKQWYSGKPIRWITMCSFCFTNLINLFWCVFLVLGNHDYRGDVLAELSPLLQKIDSRWLCLRSFILNAGEICSASRLFDPSYLSHGCFCLARNCGLLLCGHNSLCGILLDQPRE